MDDIQNVWLLVRRIKAALAEWDALERHDAHLYGSTVIEDWGHYLSTLMLGKSRKGAYTRRDEVYD